MENIIVSSVIEDFMDSATAAEARAAIGVSASGVATWGAITGTLSAQTDLQSALDARQPLDADLTAIAALSTTNFGRSLLTQADAAAARTTIGAGTGNGTVTAVSVASANGISGSSSGGATPELTLSLEAITPTTVTASDHISALGIIEVKPNDIDPFPVARIWETAGVGYTDIYTNRQTPGGFIGLPDVAYGIIITTGNLTDITDLPDHTSGTVNGNTIASGSTSGTNTGDQDLSSYSSIGLAAGLAIALGY